MLSLVIVVLLILWLLGGVIIPVGTNAVHLLLVIVLVLVILRLFQRGDV